MGGDEEAGAAYDGRAQAFHRRENEVDALVRCRERVIVAGRRPVARRSTDTTV